MHCQPTGKGQANATFPSQIRPNHQEKTEELKQSLLMVQAWAKVRRSLQAFKKMIDASSSMP